MALVNKPKLHDILQTVGEPHPRSLEGIKRIEDEVVDQYKTERVVKQVLVVGLKMIPKAGGLLSGLLQVLMPVPDEPLLTWNSIEERVAKIAEEKVNEFQAKTMKNTVTGLVKNLQAYANEQTKPAKAAIFSNILFFLNAQQPHFLEQPAPQLTIGYLVLFGTVQLCMLREDALYHSEHFNTGIPDPGEEGRRKYIGEALEKLLPAVESAKTRAIEWKVAKIFKSDVRTKRVSTGIKGASETIYSQDITDTSKPTGSFGSKFSYQWSSVEPETQIERVKVKVIFEDLRDTIRSNYAAQLEAVLLPTLTWPSFAKFGNDSKPDIRFRYTHDHLWRSYRAGYFDHTGDDIAMGVEYVNHYSYFAKNGPITSFKVWKAFDVPCGIQVTYGDQQTDPIGRCQGKHDEDLWVYKDEMITSWGMSLMWNYRLRGLTLTKSKLEDPSSGSATLNCAMDGRVANHSYDGRVAAKASTTGAVTNALLYVTAWSTKDWDSSTKGDRSNAVATPLARLNFVVGRVHLVSL